LNGSGELENIKGTVPSPQTSLQALARDFFTLYGAYVRDDGDARLQVRLPPDLALHFGRDRLYLVFSAAELSPYEDLVAYGSHIFDQMMAWLADRGSRTSWQLPVRAFDHTFDDGPPPELAFVNCTVEQASARSREELYFFFNFCLTFTADDLRQEIYTIVLDDKGCPHPEMQRALSLPPDRALLTPLEGDPLQETAGGYVPPAEVPTLTRLAELAEQAQALAVNHAEAQAAALEVDLHKRLRRAVVRLTSYYQRQIEEIAARDETRAGEARQVMQEDLQRKIADELESHRLRVQVRLLSTAQVGRPVRHYQMALQSRHSAGTLALQRDLYTGDLEPVLCHACGQPATEIALCSAGHIAGADCVHTCCDCERDVCTACGVQNCAVCRRPVCQECKSICHVCGGWVCGEHSLECPICGRKACTAHSFRCKICGRRYCTACQARRGVCETCAALLPVSLEDVAGWTGVLAELRRRYPRWAVGQNARYCIYRGVRFLGHVVVVQDRRTDEIVSRREGGLRARWGL